MAWLARSIANSLKLDEDDEDDQKQRVGGDDETVSNQSISDSQSPRGVKEDITELTKTLRSQFWGVASFLSPPPPSSPDLKERTDHAREGGDEDLIAGIKNDFAEIGGRFRTGMSRLSGNLPVSELRTGISKLSVHLPVSEFTKIASNFLQLSSEDVDLKDYDKDVGVTEELVSFAKDLAMHPETWLDFPIPDEEDDSFNDFEMSDAQYEHALAVERLAPSLASLRIELCPEYMSENCFWRIYFVLVHPILSKDDALLLSTPQVLEARAMLSHELQKTNKLPMEAGSSEANNAVIVEQPLDVPHEPLPEAATVRIVSTIKSSDFQTDKHPIESKEIQIVDKSVIEETASSSKLINVQVDDEEEDDADDWLNDEEETSSVGAIEGRANTNHPPGEDDEDVSFSDLEEEDEGDVKVSYKKVTNSGSDSSNKNSPDWVQLEEVKVKKDSNDWLNVDEL
ncbi:PREDICTED: uncharacterized protein LOC104727254 [Camelina sativa]|uniref:Uncharacterized protein LOC104727254 n=1 Tax=Camelina sativa TaxID=90675 RepID=A0ABM0UQL8_CAMSA|nr:PREDICTED: uncharacterized protein LOC104727254 [Camelina sativa]